jgi:polysaccharide pyruvyl transferase WcaK-like protein
MNILHIASFHGNIGDNASHIGLNSIFKQIGLNACITRLEIRQFYHNAANRVRKYFDDNFANYCNEFDLVVFGGGGYLDYWMTESKTSMTFDINEVVMDKIKVPFLFTSVGCIPRGSVSNECRDKFTKFLTYTAKRSDWNIFFRNDGSLNHISKEIDHSLALNFREILDNGFFYLDSRMKDFALVKKEYVVMNVAYDQVISKYTTSGLAEQDEYYKEVSKVILRIIEEKNYHVILVPHIYSDLKSIDKLLDIIPENHRRENISIGPNLTGLHGANINFSIYANANIAIANRLHANICSLSMGSKVIGLSALTRIHELYKSLDLSSQCIEIRSGLSMHLFEKIEKLLSMNDSLYMQKIDNSLNKKRVDTLEAYKKYFQDIID